MTRPVQDVQLVLQLASVGASKRSISHRLGVSRAAIRDWLSDPLRAMHGRNGAQPTTVCRGQCLPADRSQERAYTYLLGMYLGDGYIARHPRTYRLRVSCDQRYPGIMEDVGSAIQKLVPAKVGRVRSVGCDEVYAYSKHWPCLFPQHGFGVKHERPIELEPWQVAIVHQFPRPFIRGLIHSDGWRGDNVAIKHTELAIEYRTYSRYQFSNHSKDIRDLFCWALDLIGVHWTQSNQWTISVSRRKDIHYLDSFVGPKR